MPVNPVKPDLSGYVGAYKMTAGNNADGSDATDFNEGYLSSYKYVKIAPVTDTPDNPEGGLSAGTIVGIVAGSVAVAGLGGFALFWFVIKKKTWVELVAIFKKK